MSFVHLQVSSAYSLLSSTVSIPSLVKKASKLGFQSLAITDRNVMYGVIPFYKECIKENIKPIIGLTVDVALSVEGSAPLVLLAKDYEGYESLVKISSVVGTKTPDGIPMKWLKGYGKGLIAITPGLEGEIEQLLLQGQMKKAKEAVRTYQNIFGKENFFFSLQNHGLQEQKELYPLLNQLSIEMEAQTVATNNVQFLEKEDRFALECLLAIRDGGKLSEEGRGKVESEEYFFKTQEEMIGLFSNDADALKNTISIAEKCNVTIPFHQQLLPKYPLPLHTDSSEVLKETCFKGLKDRGKASSNDYLERLQYELGIISRMGFNDYFLIVWDFMKYARERGILTGPGRGSAAGSLVAYVLRITDVDPIEHELLFERFLNPERVTMPDIDIDFPDHRRDEVIEYVVKKYGDLHVAQIITFGTLAAKASLRDTARVFGLNTKEQEQLSKLIPSKLGISLKAAYKESEGLRKFVEGSELHEKLFRTALKLEGLPRHTSTHAAGVVISENPLVNLIPIQESGSGVHLTQYSMDILEEIGLLKMDFLGLRNLSILERIVQNVKKGTNGTFSLENIPMDDDETFQLLSKGSTNGIFQLESEGMRNVLMKLKPSTFEDIVAVNALYRPGPMENIPVYIKRKHGRETIEYPHPDLEPILQKTYGVIVYQEQIMQIASKMAGFSLGEADLLRRAVGKKKKEILNEQRNHFIKGAQKKGYTLEVANNIYDLIVRFANYGFNRSHAVAYSMIAYQLAYLKAHYSAYFLASLLTSAIGNDVKVALYIRESTQHHIEILPPSINNSHFAFIVEGKKRIRYSLASIKGVGAAALREIFRARREKPFSDLFDFCLRVSQKAVNRKTLEALIFSGAFDEFGEDRAVLLASLDVAIEHAELVNPDEENYDLFEDEEAFLLKPKYIEVENLELTTKLQYEKQVLGLYLSDHPSSSYRELFYHANATFVADLQNKNHKAVVGGYITSLKTIRTKKGEVMAFLQISDESGDIEAVVFPSVYRKHMNKIQEGAIQLFEGKLEIRNEKLQLIVNTVESIEELTARIKNNDRKLFLKIERSQDPQLIMNKVRKVIQKHKGNQPVVVYYELENKGIQLPPNLRINANWEALEELKSFLGENNVVLK
ncbi:DNA polymerase III subunit alpha [Bacillus seohaeanensis]|jgi:DNA polymerase III subunit alpha|uniref:DNA polymerase III subunit alpha n=1 Tax=Bacillus seohaeanensis TaxID=284580 RepID=A0ABW5RSN7_9BACI